IPGIEDIGLTTNGVMLGRQAEDLYHAGLRRLNLSLDALDPFVFGEMNGRGTNPQIVLKNIELAKEMGFHMKVNMVVKKGVNEQEILQWETNFKEGALTLVFLKSRMLVNNMLGVFEKVWTKKEYIRCWKKNLILSQ